MGLVDFSTLFLKHHGHTCHNLFISQHLNSTLWTDSLMMIIIAIVSLVESTGVYLALADITGEDLDEKRLRNGYRAEGFAVFLGGVFNTFPYTGFSQNVGLVQLSGIKTRKPIYFTAGFLIVF
jgi:xanthine permease